MLAPETVQKLKPSSSTVASAGLGIPVSIILVWITDMVLQHFGLEKVPVEVATAGGAVCSFIIGYFFPGGRSDDVA